MLEESSGQRPCRHQEQLEEHRLDLFVCPSTIAKSTSCADYRSIVLITASRRQSESRASSSPPLSPPAGNSPLAIDYGSPSPQNRGASSVNPISIVETAASPSLLSASQPGPMLSSLQLGRSESVQTASTRASSSGTGQSYRTPAVDDHAFIAPPPVDLDSEYSEATDDEEGRSRRKGWRKAFSRGKKGSEGSTRSSSPGRTVSTSQTSSRATQQPPPAKAAPVAPIPIPAQQENRRLSVGQAAAPGARRKSVEGSRPNTPLRESHVPLPAFGAQDASRPAKASAETKKSSSTSDRQGMPTSATAPMPIRPSKSVSPPHASDRIISDLLSSSPSQSMAATSTSSRKASVSNLGKSPGSYHTTSPTSQHHTPQYGSSPHESGSHLRAVKNPRPAGQEKEGGGSISKKEAKKIADDKAKKDIDAIKDAVSPVLSCDLCLVQSNLTHLTTGRKYRTPCMTGHCLLSSIFAEVQNLRQHHTYLISRFSGIY